MDGDLVWRVEEACLNAWPSPRQIVVDGYLLRAAGGPSRRINAAGPLRCAGDPERAVAACLPIFAGLGQRPIFRVPDIAPALDPVLTRLGYGVEGESLTLLRDLAELPPTADRAVNLSGTPDAAWLALRTAASGADPAAMRALRSAADAVILPRAFARLAASEAEASGSGAVAFAVVDRDLVVIEAVATSAAVRGRGLAGRVVTALLRWGRDRGATGACLQVQADNAPAQALYARLGFTRELYRYHYRTLPNRG